MPPYTANNTVYYDPLISTISTSATSSAPTVYTTIGPTSISFVNEGPEKKMKEYCDKVDQHVDKLEEDIEFLNEKRLSHDELLEVLVNANIEKDNKIKTLESSVAYLKTYTSHLEAVIHMLEDKLK